MITVNENFLKLQAGYLFPEIGRRVREFKAENPDARLISLGIGDVTQPLAPAATDAKRPWPSTKFNQLRFCRPQTECPARRCGCANALVHSQIPHSRSWFPNKRDLQKRQRNARPRATRVSRSAGVASGRGRMGCGSPRETAGGRQWRGCGLGQIRVTDATGR